MVKLVIKLAIVALIANAMYQGIPPYYNNWKFQDALKELATFPGYKATVPDVLTKCERIAKEYDLDLGREDFTVVLTAGGKTATIDTSYTVELKFVPGHPRPHTFLIHVVGDPPRFGALTP
jgi:hypothetical protein